MNVPRAATTPTKASNESAAAEKLRARASELNFDSTISRELVHRNFIDHVLVTDLQKLDDSHFLCASRLPQLHGYFNEERTVPCCSLLAISEIARQASIALSHRYLKIPAGYSQVMHSANARMENLFAPRTVTPATAEFLVEVTLTDRRHRRNGDLIGLKAEYSGYSDYSRVFNSHGHWTLLPKKLYQRLRHQVSTSAIEDGVAAGSDRRPIEPGSVGRETTRNVFISSPAPRASVPGAYSAHLLADPRHPYFFEHKIDHVPGMLLLEGCNQMAVAITAELCDRPPRDFKLESYEMRFSRFAGLEAPVLLEMPVAPVRDTSAGRDSAAFQITASQDQVVLAEFDITVACQTAADE